MTSPSDGELGDRMEAEEVRRRMNALEQRQDEWMHQANRTLDELRVDADRLLRRLERLLAALDEETDHITYDRS